MKGLQLASAYYHQAVRPLLDDHFPSLAYSTARLGSGFDVLGFDDQVSRDHDWGPKFDLFLAPSDAQHPEAIDKRLADHLPQMFEGYSTRYRLNTDGTHDFSPDGDPSLHGINITTVPAWFSEYLGANPGDGVTIRDWLSFAPQKLRTIASGDCFHDGLGTITQIRHKLDWYPHDLWLYLMTNQWRKVDQEEPFVGRTGDVGDELGSRLVGARLVRELMTLAFLVERQFPPYTKWFGTAFAQLKFADELPPLFKAITESQDWNTREGHLTDAYLILGRTHNALDITPEIEPGVSPFHSRPYLVPHSERFVFALHKAITSDQVLALPRHTGAVWQFADSTDILSSADRCRQLAQALYA